MHSSSLVELWILPILVVKTPNKGASKRLVVAWRWFELNPALVQEGLFQVLQWILLEFSKWLLEQHCAGEAFLSFLVVKMLNKGASKGKVAWRWLTQPCITSPKCNGACWNSANDAEQQFGKAAYFTSNFLIKVVPKGKLLEDELNSTLHQSRKVCQLLHCSLLNKGATKGRLSEDDLKSTLHQSRNVHFNFCNGSHGNLANDTEYKYAGAAFFTCFGQWTIWIEVLP